MADLRFRNPHPTAIRIALGIDDDDHLAGAIVAARSLDQTWRVEEHDHRFECVDGVWWRHNRIVRVTLDDRGAEIARETVAVNHARTCYTPRAQLPA